MTRSRLDREKHLRYGSAAWIALGVWAFVFCATASAGSITATIETKEPVRKVYAVRWDNTPTGQYARVFEGRIDGDRVVINDLTPGRYNLRFETRDGLIEGWDADVPRSDYEQEQPLSDESRATILEKMSGDIVCGFPDEVVVLDVQGNIQHAVVLITTLRRRPFTESVGLNTTTWIWSVNRWSWEDPDEVTWVPVQERPSYALVRERLKPPQYEAKKIVYARHLGGIALSEEKPDIVLDKMSLPTPMEGVHAVNPDGRPTTEIVLKPKGKSPPTAPPDPETKE